MPQQITPGNIDLHSRPTLHNADGSISTVRSMSFGTDAGEVLVPTVGPNGEDLSEEEAMALYEQSGQHLGIFATPESATAYAEQLHIDQEREYMNYSFEEPGVDLFALPEGTPEQPIAPVNPENARRTAQLAALASLGASEEAGGIFASMDAKTDAYLAQIEQLGETSVREQISAERQANRLEALTSVLHDNLPDGDPELTSGAVAAYNNLSQLDAREDAAYAMEQQAVERVQNLAAGGNITQARLMLQNLETGNALDVIRDYTTKQLILESALARAQQNQQDQPWFRDVADFVLAAVPLYSPSRTGNVDVADSVKNWYDSIFAGERFRNEADSLWDMPVRDFAQFVDGDFLTNLRENATLFGYTNNTEMLELMSGLTQRTPSAFETNAWAAADIAGFVPWTKAARLGGSLTSMMVRTGARREASELMGRAALDILQEGSETATARSGMSADQVARNMEVSAIAPEGSISRVPIADDGIAAAERGRAMLAELPALEARTRLDQAEAAAALKTIQTRYERQFGRDIKDVNVTNVELAGGSTTNRVEFTLGRKNGGGFASEAQANRYGGSIAMKGEAIVDESGQWFYRVAEDMPETGFFTRLLNVLTPSPMRFALNARNVGDTALANAAAVAGSARNKMLKTLVEPFETTFRQLAGHERDALGQVLQAGDTHGTWFSRDQLELLYQRRLKRSPSQRELNAYQAARYINDMEYALRNDDIYKQRVVKGYKSVSFDTGRGRVDLENAIIDRELKDMPRTRIFDVSTGRHYAENGALTQRQWERMKGQGYQLVSLERPLRMADGTTVKTFLVKGKDMVVDNLKRQQISYRAGGHRMYRGKYFVKQTVIGKQMDTGKEFLENPNTYIAAQTKAEAKYWASRMEDARLAHLDGADLSGIDEIFGGEAGFPTAEEFVRMMDDPAGAFQKNTKFDVYFDREMPDEYLQDGQALDFVDPDDTGFNGFLRVQGRMYTGRKGERLPDYLGEKAPLLDPFETINRSLMNISALTSFGDYKIQAVERWMKTFGKLLDVRDMPEGLSDMRLFMEAPLKKGGNDATSRARNAALAQRQIIKRTLGWKTENDLRGEQWTRHLSEWVAGDQIDGVVPSARRFVSGVDWWQDKNPIAALRSFAFDLKLGLFNVAQLPMQLSTAAAATALSPKLGMQGWAMIAPMRFMLGGRTLTREAFEARLDQLVKNGVHDLGGFKSSDDFKDFVRSATRSGFFDLGGTHGLMDSYGPAASLDGFNSGVKRFREAGRFFFFEAERWNRIVAWRIAYDEAIQSGLKKGSPEFAAALAGRAEEYSFNMSRESQAWWQKGLLSIPTQFWAYNARMLEAMTVGNFTPAQKMRLVASQTLLYGSAGLPITGAISAWYKGENPDAVVDGPLSLEADMSNPFATLDRGLVDQFVLSTTGVNALVGQRYGTGGWVPELVKNIFGMSSYGEVSAADMLGGATFNIMGKLGTDVMRPVIEYMSAESGDEGRPLRSQAILQLASNVSTLGNGIKAYMVFNYGTFRSGAGSTSVDDLPSQTAFAVALGIQPGEMDEISAMAAFFKNKSEAIKEASKVISNYRVDMLNRPDQRESIMDEVNAFVRLLPADVRQAALERANGDVNPSLYASYVERLQTEQLEQERNGPTD